MEQKHTLAHPTDRVPIQMRMSNVYTHAHTHTHAYMCAYSVSGGSEERSNMCASMYCSAHKDDDDDNENGGGGDGNSDNPSKNATK